LPNLAGAAAMTARRVAKDPMITGERLCRPGFTAAPRVPDGFASPSIALGCREEAPAA
jgi:hypothetical protein